LYLIGNQVELTQAAGGGRYVVSGLKYGKQNDDLDATVFGSITRAVQTRTWLYTLLGVEDPQLTTTVPESSLIK